MRSTIVLFSFWVTRAASLPPFYQQEAKCQSLHPSSDFFSVLRDVALSTSFRDLINLPTGNMSTGKESSIRSDVYDWAPITSQSATAEDIADQFDRDVDTLLTESAATTMMPTPLSRRSLGDNELHFILFSVPRAVAFSTARRDRISLSDCSR